MPLKDPLPPTRTLSLIPSSGIQFLDFRLNSADRRLPREWGCFDASAKGSDPKPGEFGLASRDDEPMRRQGTALPAKYAVDRRGVLEMAEGRWVPVPILRRMGRSFAEGPSNWARLMLLRLEQPDPAGNDHHLVLAFDTALMEQVEGRPYLAPAPRDAQAGEVFALAEEERALAWFLGERWVRAWVFEIHREMLERRQQQRAGKRRASPLTDDEVAEELSGTGPAEPLLRYLALIDLLARAEVFPEHFRLIDSVSRRHVFIDCDLVLDIGNSRTCGLIVERTAEGGADVAQAAKLELRDLTLPNRVVSDPFDSRVEFAEATFGKTNLSLLSGRTGAFEWPTMTRVGPEAQRLGGLRSGHEGRSGLSSPKRYLWATEPVVQPWRINPATLAGDREPLAVHGPMVQLIDDAGEALHLRREGEDALPALEPRYSRSSLFTFLLTEVLAHALAMINAPSHRMRRVNGETPRRLRRIIMTMPSALSLAERRILRQRAEAARDLIYLLLGLARPGRSAGPGGGEGAGPVWDVPGIVKPELLLVWDEASATQVVYLYTQIAKNFAGHARSFFSLYRRPDNPEPDTLRVATLDIGGGTTDLVVSAFSYEGSGNTVTIFPRQLFREGFNLAGDDVLYRIIQAHVLKAIELAAEAAGVPSGAALTTELFGGNRGTMDVGEQMRRQQFATRIAAPIALGMLSRYETSEESGEARRQNVPFAAFLGAEADGIAPLVDWVNSEVARRGGAGFDLGRMEFALDLDQVALTVRSVLAPMLGALAELVWRYRCDLLLLSGRPSRLPAVHDLLAEHLPMLVGRIVPLHRFRVGPWYPFRDLHARIDDPKTTAAVGAMICALAEGGIEHFNFRSDRLKQQRSTARYVGRLDGNGRIPAEDCYYEIDLDDPERDLAERSFEYRGVMALGFRQFPNAWWPATRLYSLTYAGDEQRGQLHAMTPIQVQLRRKRRRRGEELGEDLDIDSALTSPDSGSRQVKGALALKLQTLDDSEGYWLDTGVLRRR
ncbi:MAG: hypothetical protein K0S81_2928 [Rhodospirillales bacterium]|nr:hypothetical protein [Rhodospirillales bacterium]